MGICVFLIGQWLGIGFLTNICQVIVGVVVYRAGHGDHDNWRDHSQYSDAGIRNQIQVKERELQQKKKELERLKQLMKERFKANGL